MESVKQEIRSSLSVMEREVREEQKHLADAVSVWDYAFLVRREAGREIWTEAFGQAIREHEIIRIPEKQEPYYIDRSLTIPSNRRLEAEPQATVLLTPECDTLLLRNEHTRDGTHRPVPENAPKDRNIQITGGIWGESRKTRMGYGKSGKYDENRSFYGVSTCMLFNQVEGLQLSDMTFFHTAGFAVQLGNLKNAVVENIRFRQCFADGIHVGGNTENLIVRHVSGEVGDDLVALNVYDWQDSSVTFGPGENILCEDIQAPENCECPAIRMETGKYFFDDGTEIDCALRRTVISHVRGIRTFKLYFQTPRYTIGQSPERGDVGSCDELFFEDIDTDLLAPIDRLPPYLESDPIRGSFAAFELGANIRRISFENIRLKLYKEKYPYSYLLCIGPKSVRIGDLELFDPYLSSHADEVYLKDIVVNGEPVTDFTDLIREISFCDINHDGHSTASGTIHRIITQA